MDNYDFLEFEKTLWLEMDLDFKLLSVLKHCTKIFRKEMFNTLSKSLQVIIVCSNTKVEEHRKMFFEPLCDIGKNITAIFYMPQVPNSLLSEAWN